LTIAGSVVRWAAVGWLAGRVELGSVALVGFVRLGRVLRRVGPRVGGLAGRAG
jgi:hypothetical protein